MWFRSNRVRTRGYSTDISPSVLCQTFLHKHFTQRSLPDFSTQTFHPAFSARLLYTDISPSVLCQTSLHRHFTQRSLPDFSTRLRSGSCEMVPAIPAAGAAYISPFLLTSETRCSVEMIISLLFHIKYSSMCISLANIKRYQFCTSERKKARETQREGERDMSLAFLCIKNKRYCISPCVYVSKMWASFCMTLDLLVHMRGSGSGRCSLANIKNTRFCISLLVNIRFVLTSKIRG